MKVQFREWLCDLNINRYHDNKRVALSLTDDEGPVATCTVNVPEAKLEPDEVLIKDWSENEGMLEALVAAKIVEDTGRTVSTGYVQANVCRLLIEV